MPAKAKVKSKPIKKAATRKAEITCVASFIEIGDRFLPSYVLCDCPIGSWAGVEGMQNMVSLEMTNSLIANFKGCNGASKLERLTLTGAPVTKFKYYRLMALLAFSGLTEIDGSAIKDEERQQVERNAKGLRAKVLEGVILRSLPQRMESMDVPPIIAAMKGPLATVAFSRFFSDSSIERASREICLADENVELDDEVKARVCIAKLRVLFTGITPRMNIARFFDEFQETVNEMPKGLQSLSKAYEIMDKAMQVRGKLEEGVKAVLDDALEVYGRVIGVLGKSELKTHCRDFIEASNAFVEEVKEMRSVDTIVDEMERLSEKQGQRVLPFVCIIGDVEAAIARKKDVLSNGDKTALAVAIRVAKYTGRMGALAEQLSKVAPSEFAVERALCQNAERERNNIVQLISLPPTAAKLKMEIESVREEHIGSLVVILLALKHEFTEVVRDMPDRKKRMEAMNKDIERMGELSKWIAQSRKYIGDPTVVGGTLEEIGTDCQRFVGDHTHKMLESARDEIEKEIAATSNVNTG